MMRDAGISGLGVEATNARKLCEPRRQKTRDHSYGPSLPGDGLVQPKAST